ncbi:hypothetical protein LUCX_135 [Xanthomonas phage vB_XciM_LucasX]|nr:hypothetical protein LUCX_135 [Xanthomonas phage vB_XciM_LucasX]
MSTGRWWSHRGRRFMAGIGTREPPTELIPMIQDIGECLCDDLVAITSGDAQGCDEHFVAGAMRSSKWPSIGARVFLPWNGTKRHDDTRRYEDGKIYFDASKFENWQEAHDLALAARGSWEGLGRGGIALQSRNPYQVLLDDLRSPVGGVVCYAKPIGKKGNVKGGTNTAVRLALDRNIEVINLATDEGMERALKYLRKHNKPY